MRTYCLSDFHIQDALHPPLYTEAKESALVRALGEADAEGATVLLAGDVFDVTGMQQPQGMDAFWSSLELSDADKPAPDARTPAQLVDACAARFRPTFDALTRFAVSSRLWILAGNHDCALKDPSVKAAVARNLGGANASIKYLAEARLGTFALVRHGQEYDPSNHTATSCENRGAAITRVTYHALIPALVELGLPREVAELIPSVRPEENLVAGLDAYLGDKELDTFLRAFVEILRANGYWSGLESALVHLGEIVGLLTPARVRSELAGDGNVKQLVRQGAELLMPGLAPDAIVVMGHTHELDSTNRYVNLGTWIDHVRGLDSASIAAMDRTLPVLVVDDEARTAELRDRGKDDAPCLWRAGG